MPPSSARDNRLESFPRIRLGAPVGWFDFLSPKKKNDSAAAEAARATTAGVEGPPEFVRAVALQTEYWTSDAEERARLEARGVGQLEGRELLRLHHLYCMALVADAGDAATVEKLRVTRRRLGSPESPYRPQPAMVWQQRRAQEGGERPPELQGLLLNASLSHLGCLEVIRLDAADKPVKLDFIPFGDLSGMILGPPTLLRAAKVFLEGGGAEIVSLPLLYGLTWTLGGEDDRAGRVTRFVAHLPSSPDAAAETWHDLGSGVGIGHQDFQVLGQGGGGTLFGLATMAEVMFPLDVRDPRFDERARRRGLDPEEIRRQMS